MKVNNIYEVSLEISTSMVKSYELDMDEEEKVTKLIVEVELPKTMKVDFKNRVVIDVFNQSVKGEGKNLFSITNMECEELKEYCLSDKFFKYGNNWYLDRSKCYD